MAFLASLLHQNPQKSPPFRGSSQIRATAEHCLRDSFDLRREATMAKKVKLTVSEGIGPQKEFVFQNPARSVVGRADDCELRFPMDPAHMDVSRHNWLIETGP